MKHLRIFSVVDKSQIRKSILIPLVALVLSSFVYIALSVRISNISLLSFRIVSVTICFSSRYSFYLIRGVLQIWEHSSPYYLLISDFIFGIAGGYTSIIGEIRFHKPDQRL